LHSDGEDMKPGILSRLFGLLRRGLVQNVLALYSVQFVNYLLPLITIPFLTRVLGREGWGLYAFFQSFALYAYTIVDYSFIMAGTREVSRQRADLPARADILAGVIGAKVLLAGGVLAGGLILQLFVPAFQAHLLLYWMGIVWGISMSLNLLWYFQGMERMRTAAGLDLSAKILATAAIFLLVKSPDDTWMIFLLYSIANLLSLAVATILAYQVIPLHRPTWQLSRQTLRTGWNLFTARLAVNIFAAGNSFILGLFTSPGAVGYFAGADKISKASASLCEPVSSTLFPRLALIVHEAPDHALHLVRRSITAMLVIGGSLSTLIFATAPFLIHTILGPGYTEAILMLRVMSPLPLIIAMTNVFGVQWMLSLRLDRQYNAIIISAVILNLILALILAPRFEGLGMAWAVLISKLAELVGVTLVLMLNKVHPLQLQRENLVSLLLRSRPDAH
jgi:PST family polysaccharide transporter